MTDPVPVLTGARQVADRYDAFVVDLWGVIHDGEQLYDGVLEALAGLRQSGRQVCLLSNVPRRLPSVRDRMRRIGLADEHYDHIMSSGEATHLALAHRPTDAHKALGDRFVHIGTEWDEDVVHGLELEKVASTSHADFVLNSGITAKDQRVEHFEELLMAAADRSLPMICANPDLVVMRGGSLGICAGSIAARYEQIGGDVIYHGKPTEGVYRDCLDLLGHPDSSRVLAIGDSFRTDVKGASSMGFDSLFVTHGIHAAELLNDGMPNGKAIAEAGAQEGVRPTYAIASLVW
ncbi:MAG: TIGR01459 family HAD-type hydrolase [Pseudomonadota bacterium]